MTEGGNPLELETISQRLSEQSLQEQLEKALSENAKLRRLLHSMTEERLRTSAEEQVDIAYERNFQHTRG